MITNISTRRALTRVLIAGAASVAILGGICVAPAQAAAVDGTAAVQTTPAIDAITYIGSGLGTAEVSNDGQGNFVANRYTDDASMWLSPEFRLSGVPADTRVSMRITLDGSASRVELTQNRFGLWEQFGSTALSRPGAKHRVVGFDVLVGTQVIGSLTVNFAPKADEPQDFNPNAIDGQLTAPGNVRVTGDTLAWDAVAKAERYQITAYRYAATGKAVDLWKVDSDSLATTRESVSEIAAFLDLPAGDYRFTIKASTLHNGYWNGTLASPFSNKTDLVTIA
ncbi:MAG: hypothetical protein LBV06_02300 [Propionibacteriaceae bacterium]|jgi:hypothetical protein|nr:hypothetical protein [Propionibacteriaceae bacterium]